MTTEEKNSENQPAEPQMAQGEVSPQTDALSEPELLQSEDLKQLVETLLFITDRPVKPSRLAEVIENTDARRVREVILALQTEYNERKSAIQIVEVGGGFQMATKPEFGRWVRRLYNEKMTTRLSNAALETLAIVAYKQPITRAEMEGIRGVDVAGPLEKLLDRGLVRVVGKRDTIGRPMVYGTTDEFLRTFGLNKISELPDLQVFASKSLEKKQEDLPFGEVLPPLGDPAIIPLEQLEGAEKLEALSASQPDPFFERMSYNKGNLTDPLPADLPADSQPTGPLTEPLPATADAEEKDSASQAAVSSSIPSQENNK